MKLKINGFMNELDFIENKVNILEIKDTKCFTNTIQKINDKIEGIDVDDIYLLGNDEEELSMKKEMFMVTDLFNIDFNSKKILQKLYNKISDNIKIDNDIRLQGLLVELRKCIVEEINELPIECLMSDDIDIVNILKLYNLKIDVLLYETILEKVEFLIDLNAILNMFKIIVIPNLKIYLSDEELVELYKYSLYNNVKLLLIEKNIKQKLEYENILVIDENFEDYIL